MAKNGEVLNEKKEWYRKKLPARLDKWANTEYYNTVLQLYVKEYDV